jgi:hypothetical protein
MTWPVVRHGEARIGTTLVESYHRLHHDWAIFVTPSIRMEVRTKKADGRKEGWMDGRMEGTKDQGVAAFLLN